MMALLLPVPLHSSMPVSMSVCHHALLSVLFDVGARATINRIKDYGIKGMVSHFNP
jgi:hypothetical protein